MSTVKPDTSKLREYVLSLDKSSRDEYAKKCRTTLGHLNQIIYGNRSCNPVLAIELDKQSNGRVLCDELCPDADWSYVRTGQTKEATA